ncbi:helix-turn-helix domain-containing protein [Alistipes sp. OttesenSCG-928-L06]|nr:helix-turn-helix domain-containing protein [Alistipes sp. OttesenSCG-928-L06]
MARIENAAQYKAAMDRIEELLPLVNEDTAVEDKNSVELVLLSELVAEYEEYIYPIKTPSLIDILKLRMYEMGLTQKMLAEILGVSTSRVNEYLTGKSEPTLKVARDMNRKLSIDADIILGVS